MIRFIIFFFLGTTFMCAQNPGIDKARSLYGKASEEEKAAQQLLELTKNQDENQPVMLGYKAAAHMMMAKHVGNPFKKMSYFNKGKDYLSMAIAAENDNLELRFIRFAVQAEAPGFLGYRSNLEEDKALLVKGVAQLNDAKLRAIILNYLKTSKALTAAEKERLE